MLDAHHGASQVDGYGFVEVCEVEFFDGAQSAHEACVAVVHVQLALPAHGFVHQCRHVLLVSHIAAHEMRMVSELVRELASSLFVDVCDDDVGAMLHEQARRRLPYSTSAPGYHHHFACKPVMSFQALIFIHATKYSTFHIALTEVS